MRTFTWFVALPTVLVYVAICALVLVTLHLMTNEINRIDGDRGRKAIGAAFESLVLRLSGQVTDEATWTEAYVNTYVAFNAAWLDGTWGSAARSDGYYDTSLITDSKGTVLFGESVTGQLTGSVADHLSGTADALAALDAAIRLQGDGAVVQGFARSGDKVAGFAAAVIHGGSGQVTVPAAERRILWFAKLVDAPVLNEITHVFQAPMPRPVLDEAVQPGEETQPLLDATGGEVAAIAWQPLRPGDAAFTHAASIASIVLLVIGILIYIVLIAFRRSVERRAESEERDWVGARYDATTGLLNRFGLEETILRLIPKRRAELPVAVACIEFEGLKDVTATYGQETAEALLARLADLIDTGIGKGAEIARIGLDQFALLRAGEDAGERMRQYSQVVLELTAEAIPLDNLLIKLAASIGTAETVVTRKTAGTALTLATSALQRARETGGNHIVPYDPSIEESRARRLAMQADIRRGLDADEFDLDYQPIFDFASETMLGVEALLRWPRRAGGPMSPGEFIPAAEASGLIEDLGLFALRRACHDIATFDGLKLSVNVSTVQFRSPTLATKIDGILASSGFPADRLQLEITESFLLAHPERAKAIIEELRNRGIAIALDDFGIGFSSIGYLRQFSFDRVKLDRSLVDEIDSDPLKAAMVESTMLIAFAMGLAVTAEGVERREEAATLTRLGCREFQGYLFARPLSLNALARLIGQTEELRKAS